MIFRHSLRFRIILSFALFSILLSVLFALFIHWSVHIIEDAVYWEQLQYEADQYIAALRKNPAAPPPHSVFIQAYMGRENLPSILRQSIGLRGEGVYETRGPFGLGGTEDYSIVVRVLPDRSEFLYIVYNIGLVKNVANWRNMLYRILLGGLVFVILVGVCLGVAISRRVIAPVTQLAACIDHAAPENPPLDLSTRFYQDEVGFLAKAFDNAMARLGDFVEREKQFTRDASHELRTPVAVVKGAVELLTQSPEFQQKSIQRPVQRIARAVNDMERLIQTFLWLARENLEIVPEEQCLVLPLVEQCVEQYQPFLNGKAIAMKLIVEAQPSFPGLPTVFQIAVANLLRNAIHYTTEGAITITVRSDRVVITDTGMGIPAGDLENITSPYVRGKTSQGFGLGLAIVNRLCERFGWRLCIQSHENRGTCAELIFSPYSNQTVSSL